MGQSNTYTYPPTVMHMQSTTSPTHSFLAMQQYPQITAHNSKMVKYTTISMNKDKISGMSFCSGHTQQYQIQPTAFHIQIQFFFSSFSATVIVNNNNIKRVINRFLLCC